MKRLGFGFMVVLVLLVAAVLKIGSGEQFTASPAATDSADTRVAHGAYLVQAGDCVACHTTAGGTPFAGGRIIETPFGRLATPNITSDRDHGIGRWSSDDFWRALHNGKAPDGHFYYPAFPFPSYTKVSRSDSDAMFQYLQTLPPSAAGVVATELRFPFNRRGLMVVWRALYFRANTYQADSAHSSDWNRGAYLVQGLGHCDACHANRNLLGATSQSQGLSGALIPVVDWYAPSLSSTSEAGLRDWAPDQLVQLLHGGVTTQTAVFGPMSEVVQDSTQYLSNADLKAVVGYLQDSQASADTAPPSAGVDLGAQPRGLALYKRYCEDCHSADGTGVANMYPSLAGNRAVTMNSPLNTIRMVLQGGYAPVTADNPRPFGMPPFAQTLSDAEIADVVNVVRNSWGNRADAVAPHDVDRSRGAQSR